jgi:hypothetical protein
MTKRSDWYFLDVQIWKHQEKLEKLLAHSEERTDALQGWSWRYEEDTSTDPTEAEEAMLERIMKLADRSQAQTDRLHMRIEACKKMARLHEEELGLREEAAEQRRIRTRSKVIGSR